MLEKKRTKLYVFPLCGGTRKCPAIPDNTHTHNKLLIGGVRGGGINPSPHRRYWLVAAAAVGRNKPAAAAAEAKRKEIINQRHSAPLFSLFNAKEACVCVCPQRTTKVLAPIQMSEFEWTKSLMHKRRMHFRVGDFLSENKCMKYWRGRKWII